MSLDPWIQYTTIPNLRVILNNSVIEDNHTSTNTRTRANIGRR